MKHTTLLFISIFFFAKEDHGLRKIIERVFFKTSIVLHFVWILITFILLLFLFGEGIFLNVCSKCSYYWDSDKVFLFLLLKLSSINVEQHRIQLTILPGDEFVTVQLWHVAFLQHFCYQIVLWHVQLCVLPR